MRFPTTKGLLVYADGRTEEVQPLGKVIIKPCPGCGADQIFDSVAEMAENARTVLDGTPESASFERMLRRDPAAADRANGGVIVYVQRRSLAK